MEETDALHHLFELLDNDGSGQLDFREYLLGLALLNESNDRTGILKLVFQVFDQDESGTMSVEELTSFLARCGYADVDASDAIREATEGRDGATGVTYEEFEIFIQSHPEYMKLFTDKLEKFG